MRKPTVHRGPASRYTSAQETIVEFSFGDGTGGLISLRTVASIDPNREYDHVVELYRVDKGVLVQVSGTVVAHEGRAIVVET